MFLALKLSKIHKFFTVLIFSQNTANETRLHCNKTCLKVTKVRANKLISKTQQSF
jgi:hypothetical protein